MADPRAPTGTDPTDLPVTPPPVDRTAVRGALGLALGPAVFLVHFSLLYAFSALVCRFDWTSTRIAGVSLTTVVALAVTLVASALVLLVAHRARAASTEGRTSLEYDQPARQAFVTKLRSMVSWLSVAGMLIVTLPVFVARICS
jgi:hypothetical protein